MTIVDRFDGRILGAGSTSGVRIVIGDWERSPFGSFTDVMVATADDQRLLLAPNSTVADYVTSTYCGSNNQAMGCQGGLLPQNKPLCGKLHTLQQLY